MVVLHVPDVVPSLMCVAMFPCIAIHLDSLAVALVLLKCFRVGACVWVLVS